MPDDDYGLDPNPGDDQDANAGGDPAAGAGADPNAGGDAAGGTKDEPIGGADGASTDIYKPEGLGEHLIGQTNTETIDRLMRENKGFRDAQAKGVPAKAEDYQWNWGDKSKGSVAADDQLVKDFSTLAKEHGYTQKQLDAIPAFFEKMAEKGLIDAPYDPNKVLEGLAPESFKGSTAERQAEGAKTMTQVTNFIDQLDGKKFSDDMKTEMKLLTTSIAGVQVLKEFMGSGLNPSVSPGGAGAETAISEKDLDSRVADPRNDAFGPDYDERFAAETDTLFKKFYGE